MIERCPYRCRFEVVDEFERPCSGFPVLIRHPDGALREHFTDGRGFVDLVAHDGEHFALEAIGAPERDVFDVIHTSIGPFVH